MRYCFGVKLGMNKSFQNSNSNLRWFICIIILGTENDLEFAEIRLTITEKWRNLIKKKWRKMKKNDYKQWPAVMTQSGAIKLPPQAWNQVGPLWVESSWKIAAENKNLRIKLNWNSFDPVQVDSSWKRAPENEN